MDFGKRGGGKKRGGWKTKMDFDKGGGGIIFSGWWNYSKLVSVTCTFIREMRVYGGIDLYLCSFLLHNKMVQSSRFLYTKKFQKKKYLVSYRLGS